MASAPSAEAPSTPILEAMDAAAPPASASGCCGRSSSGRSTVGHRCVLASKIALGITYALVAALAGIVIWQLVERKSERHVVAWAVAAIFVGISVPLSLHQIHQHLLHYVSPLQRHYIRILAMVPIYSIESWFALRFKEQKIYLETAREAYEAYVIYSFFNLLAQYLGGKDAISAKLAAKGEGCHHLPPLCCVRPWKYSTGAFIRRCSLGVFQYVLLRLSTTLIVLFCEWGNVYGEGELHGDVAYPYIVAIVNASQFVAMYCLVLLYHELKPELAPLKPLGKFLVVKAVVFFSFWQAILIAGLAHYGVIQPTMDYTTEDIGAGLQDFLICVEMAIAALAHHFFFSVEDFTRPGAEAHMPMYAERRAALRAFTHILPADVIREAKSHIEAVLPIALRKGGATPKPGAPEATTPLPGAAAPGVGADSGAAGSSSAGSLPASPSLSATTAAPSGASAASVPAAGPVTYGTLAPAAAAPVAGGGAAGPAGEV